MKLATCLNPEFQILAKPKYRGNNGEPVPRGGHAAESRVLHPPFWPRD